MKKCNSLVRARWGEPRGPSSLLRVDLSVRNVVERIVESDRRRWVTDAIVYAFTHSMHNLRLIEGVGDSVAPQAKSAEPIRSSRLHSLISSTHK